MTAEDVNATEHTVSARKPFRCEAYRCTEQIRYGEDYVRLVCFPGHDAHSGRGWVGPGGEKARPWVMRICRGCYLGTDPDRKLPPRRTRSKRRPNR